ncbi:MAG: hypothetical protein LBQ08_04340 [Holosporaceae bacterium]|nr:hypothetical protein [Holosporaceae bacterium]
MKKSYYVICAVVISSFVYEANARTTIYGKEPDFSGLPIVRDSGEKEHQTASKSSSYTSDPRWAKREGGYALKKSDGSYGKTIPADKPTSNSRSYGGDYYR